MQTKIHLKYIISRQVEIKRMENDKPCRHFIINIEWLYQTMQTSKQRKMTGTKDDDKRVNFPRRHDNPRCICTQKQIFKIHESKN